METQVTSGINISVRTKYRAEYSDPSRFNFLFSYRVRIENKSEHTVQLLRRNWLIFDSNGERKEVEGEGVVGQKPVLRPGDIHEYESACNLATEMGKMSGSYLMQRKVDQKLFEVVIPEFNLIAPFRSN